MGTYVMSDLHGCYDAFLEMLDVIGFTDRDSLILAGDYVDRGKQIYELLTWLENRPSNVVMLKGNHDAEFVENVNLMEGVSKKTGYNYDFDSMDDTGELYFDTYRHLKSLSSAASSWFDYYEWIIGLIAVNTTMRKFLVWRDMLADLPYLFRTKHEDREVIVVHAGYIEDLKLTKGRYEHIEDFYLNARKEAHKLGGKENAIIIAGHTPTVVEDYFFNNGRIYKYHDEVRNCTFYDIDCGAVFRDRDSNAHLACLRIEDLEEFYV